MEKTRPGPFSFTSNTLPSPFEMACGATVCGCGTGTVCGCGTVGGTCCGACCGADAVGTLGAACCGTPAPVATKNLRQDLSPMDHGSGFPMLLFFKDGITSLQAMNLTNRPSNQHTW